MKPLDNRASDDDQHLATDDNKLIKLDTPAFLTWLESNKSFRFEAGIGGCDSYRARKETLSGVDYWYAVKKVNGKLHKRFIGKSEDVTHPRLVEISKLIRQPSTRNKQPIDNPELQPELQPEQPQQLPLPQTDLTERVAQLEQLVNQLQSEIGLLAKKLDNSDDTTSATSELEALQSENERLRLENQRLTNKVDNPIVNPVSKPDYTAIRNQVVNSWKVAKRSESRERIAVAIDKFIEELGTALQI